MAASQYRPRALVVPIVDSVLEDISVSPGGYRFKEVAADQLATVRNPGLLKPPDARLTT
jgi:hypothetical protein